MFSQTEENREIRDIQTPKRKSGKKEEESSEPLCLLETNTTIT